MRTAGSAVFGSRHEVKRLAFSLIGIAILWITTLAAFGENLFGEHIDRLGPPPEPTEMYLAFGFIGAPILIAAAAWILSGTSNPPEGTGHRTMVTFAAALAGFLIAGGLVISIYGLRSWLWPLPPLPEKD